MSTGTSEILSPGLYKYIKYYEVLIFRHLGCCYESLRNCVQTQLLFQVTLLICTITNARPMLSGGLRLARCQKGSGSGWQEGGLRPAIAEQEVVLCTYKCSATK